MINLGKSRLYVVVRNKVDYDKAKKIPDCRYIVFEKGCNIFICSESKGSFIKKRYNVFYKATDEDIDTTGIEAYQSFYRYCGREMIDSMKSACRIINSWDSYEQLHYYNFDYADTVINEPVFVYDVNSSFTYGAMQLPKEFDKLKEYMLFLYECKKQASNEVDRSKYKNMMNYLIGYFARVKEFVWLRSEIIRNSNYNINLKMSDIVDAGGKVYLSNTDSIFTDKVGSDVMKKYVGDELGQFKLEKQANKFIYKSSNIYQLGSDVVYSGVKYFARKYVNLFDGTFAQQSGIL